MMDVSFANGTSMVHRLDPRVRVFFAIALSLEIALSAHMGVLGVALFCSCTLVICSRLRLREVFFRLLPVCRFLVFLWLIVPLTYEGTPYFTYGRLTWSHEGIRLAEEISLKSLTILLIFMALVATMNLSTLGRALKRMYIPGKLVQLLLMTYRYIFVIHQEYQRLYTAMRIRGFQPGTNMHSYRTYAYLFGMLFVRASKRAERVHQAMQLRGFRGRFYSLDNFEFSRQNWVFAALMTLVFISLIVMEYGAAWGNILF